MKISKFQFQNPVLLDLQFLVNDGYEQSEHQKFNVNTTVAVQRKAENQESAIVTVTIAIGAKNESSPFFISVREQAEFSWKSDEMQNPDVEIDRLLNQNAPALLVSYIRPIIASVTNNSPYPAFNLPYLDLRKQGNED